MLRGSVVRFAVSPSSQSLTSTDHPVLRLLLGMTVSVLLFYRVVLCYACCFFVLNSFFLNNKLGGSSQGVGTVLQ